VKGVFTDLGRGFLRVLGVTKMTMLLGFTLATFNLDCIRSFRVNGEHAARNGNEEALAGLLVEFRDHWRCPVENIPGWR
jgi:hypothetical protein